MLRLISKEARELAARPLSLGVLLALPCLVLWLVAGLPDSQRPLMLYVDGAQCGVASSEGVSLEPCERPSAHELIEALSDIPDVRVVSLAPPRGNIWTFVNANDLDAAFIWSPAGMGVRGDTLGYSRGGAWAVYSDPRSRTAAARLAFVMLMAQTSDAVSNAMTDQSVRLPSAGPLMASPEIAAAAAQYTGGAQHDVTPFVSISRDGPTPTTMSWKTPGVIAVIASFIAFLVAASSLVREAEQNTLPWLSTSSGSAWFSIGLAKVVAATAIGLLSLLVMIVFAWVELGLTPNRGLLSVLGMQVLALLTAAVQGLAVSAAIGRQDQAFLLSGAYLVLATLFSGVFISLGEAGGPADWISYMLPMSYSQSNLVDWLQHGLTQALSPDEIVAPVALFGGSLIALLVSLLSFKARQ